jgi:YtkA-like
MQLDAPSRYVIAAIAFAILSAACGGSNSGGGDAGDVVNCQSDPRVLVYAPPVAVQSQSKTMKFTLMQSSPAPPARGTDTWNIHVTDANGTALPSLTLTAKPFMPDHGHAPAVNPAVANNGNGDYTASNLYFFMPGVWQVTFTAQGSSDSTVFTFCVPG